jgi:hypothetical protein
MRFAAFSISATNPKTTAVVKAGTNFGESVSKWWNKSGPKHLADAAPQKVLEGPHVFRRRSLRMDREDARFDHLRGLWLQLILMAALR